MVNLQQMSTNIVNVIDEILDNQDLCKLINYPSLVNPYIQSDFNTKAMFMKKIFPFPFDQVAITENIIQLRIYAPEVRFKNSETVDDIAVFFDVVTAKDKSVYLMNDGESKIKPYEILFQIIKTFKNKRINSIGELQFIGVKHLVINEKFDCMRLTGRVVNISG